LFSSYEDVISNCLWFFSHITNSEDDVIGRIVNSKMVKAFLDYLESAIFTIVTPALRCIGNILSSSNPSHIKMVVEGGGIEKLCKLVTHRKVSIRKEACWSASNLLADDANLVGRAMDVSMFSHLFHIVRMDVNDVKIEAIVCVTNSVLSSTLDQVEILVSLGLFTIFPSLFSEKQSRLVVAGLECLKQLLIRGEQIKERRDDPCNCFLLKMEECGLIPLVEGLQNHESLDVYQKVTQIIDMFFKPE